MRAAEITGDWLIRFPPPRSLMLDQEALRIYERAYAIGSVKEPDSDPPISFTILAIALLAGDDETSRWFAKEADTRGALQLNVFQAKGLTAKDPLLSTVPGPPISPRMSNDKQLLTLSSQGVLGTAEEWAVRVGASDIGVRHLVAAYLINPPGAHRKQMKDWGFEDRPWREKFIDWVAMRYTAESWKDVRDKVTPTKAIPSYERPEVKGEALDFNADDAVKRVLERAATSHARRTDPWLRLQTVLFALTEEAEEDAAAGQQLAVFNDPVQKNTLTYADARAKFKANENAGAVISQPFNALNISPRVLNAVETARELASSSARALGMVDLLILAGALVSRRVDADEDLAAMGFDAKDLRFALIDEAVARGEARENWEQALGEEEAPPRGRSVELNSDEPEAVIRADAKWSSDPLGIRGDVEAFATLLASQSLEPPLSIGLFGPWGAGKTTFLKRLRLAIDARTEEARAIPAGEQPTTSVREVVHIEFNAWHFAETALISSLIDTIVRELRAFIQQDNQDLGKALAQIKSAMLDQAKLQLDATVEAEATAREAVAKAAKAVVDSEAKARTQAVSLNSLLSGAWTATLQAARAQPALKDSGLEAHLDATLKDFDDLKARVETLRARPTRMLQELGWWKTIGFAVLVLLVPIAAAWVVQEIFKLNTASQTLTTFGAALGVIAVWFRTAAGAVSKVDQAIAQVAEDYEKKIAGDPDVKAARTSLAESETGAATAAATLAAAQTAFRQAQEQLAAASLPARVLSLVSSRVDDRTYAKELTTVSTARTDLQMLSDLLRQQVADARKARAAAAEKAKQKAAENAEPKAAEKGEDDKKDPKTVDRVILYIDDLDRCKPEDVVRVLQVVHMLLAFELFVVVVAVDARWVDESLKQTYRWLKSLKAEPARLGAADESSETLITPQDYLEKIFQVSFWLEPMNAARAANYLKSLVRAPRRKYEWVGGPAPAGQQMEGGRIEILAIELDYMKTLSAFVGPSPRRVKRLVNAYRLLKARLTDTQLEEFLTERQEEGGTPLRSGPYQLVIGLLVIGTGAPGSAAEILATLAQRDPRDRLDAIVTEFRARKHPDWTIAAQVLEMVMRTQNSEEISELRGWAGKVGRFLLQGSTTLPRPVRAEPTPQPVNGSP